MSVKEMQVNMNSHIGGDAGGYSSSPVVDNLSVAQHSQNDGLMQNVSHSHVSTHNTTPVAEQYYLTENNQIVKSTNSEANVAQSSPQQLETQELEHAATFPPFDFVYFPSHILWLAITFGFFYFFMSRVVLPRIGGTLELRRDRIAADLDQAARLKSEVDEAEETYHKTLDEARSRAKTIAAKATQEAKNKAEAERKSIESIVDKKLADAETRIKESRDKALAEAHKISHEIAAEIIDKISGKAVDDAALSKAMKAAGHTGSNSK